MTLKTKLPSFVAVPSEIIDEHLGKASGLYIKVILYILRTNKIDPPVIAAVLSVPVSDVEEAIRYWTSSGILPAQEVERQLESGKKQQAQAAQPLRTGSAQSPETVDSSHFKVSADREEVRFLLTTAEQILGRPLSSTEQKGFVFFLEEYDLPADVIVMAVEFCCMHDRGNYRYISKLLAGWYEQGINTHPLAEEYIRTQTERLTHEAEVMEAFGIKNRGLTTANRKYIMQWYQDYVLILKSSAWRMNGQLTRLDRLPFHISGKFCRTGTRWALRRRRTSSAATSRKILAAEANPLPGQAARLMM